MSTTSYPSKVMIDDDEEKNKAAPLPVATSNSHHEESDTIVVTDDAQKSEMDNATSMSKGDDHAKPANRKRSTDFAVRFLKSFRKTYPASIPTSVPHPDALQDAPQVENIPDTFSKKDTSPASNLAAADDTNKEKEAHAVPVKLMGMDISPPAVMDTSPGFPISTG